MHLLVIGTGAREHALAYKLKQSKHVSEVWVWPGNALTRSVYRTLDISGSQSWKDALRKAKELKFSAVIVGSEVTLAEGIADFGEEIGIPVFGPSKVAAQLESSKAFSKQVMLSAGIPTAHFEIVEGRDECKRKALQWLQQKKGVVIKASGLAAGKGVFVCFKDSDVVDAVDRLYSSMADAAKTVVLEDVLVGRESSFFCVLGKGAPHILGFAVDYKRLKDKDVGPNTGGMGCYTPVPWLPQGADEQIMNVVVNPLLTELKRRSIAYTGWLYVGLMWTKAGPSVVEFNVRLGDPEAEVLALSDKSDWALLLSEKLGLTQMQPFVANDNRLAAVAVVMASAGYPYGDGEKSPQSIPIDRLVGSEIPIFAASVNEGDKTQLLSGKGRVLVVPGCGTSLSAARTKAYERVNGISAFFSDAQWRTDIASFEDLI